MLTYCYDIECLSNLFTVTFINVDDATDERVFVISDWHSDRKELIDFLNTKMEPAAHFSLLRLTRVLVSPVRHSIR